VLASGICGTANVDRSLPATDLTIRLLLSDLQRRNAAEFYLINRDCAAKHYNQLLPKDQFHLNTRFVQDDPVEPFVQALFTSEFFPPYLGPLQQQSPGLVETAIRSKVQIGTSFEIPVGVYNTDVGSVQVRDLTPFSITLVLDEARIPVTLPWEAIESEVGGMRAARDKFLSFNELDRRLIQHCGRNVGRWLAPVLTAAGVATIGERNGDLVLLPVDA
jgi:hypothetical protein